MRMGLIAKGDAKGLPTSSILSRSLGNEMVVNVDSSEHTIVSGDVLVLCSDGLHHSVREADLASALKEYLELEEAAARLVAIANERDGSDNISVQLIRVRSVERIGIYRGRPYKLH
jgi:protein phosphatase